MKKSNSGNPFNFQFWPHHQSLESSCSRKSQIYYYCDSFYLHDMYVLLDEAEKHVVQVKYISIHTYAYNYVHKMHEKLFFPRNNAILTSVHTKQNNIITPFLFPRFSCTNKAVLFEDIHWKWFNIYRHLYLSSPPSPSLRPPKRVKSLFKETRRSKKMFTSTHTQPSDKARRGKRQRRA